jgi:hypothetical protein
LIELWSHRVIENLIPYVPELHFRQGLLHSDLQRRYYSPGDKNTPYPNIEEDMKFIKVLIVKQKLEEIFPKSKTELICSVWTIEINTC